MAAVGASDVVDGATVVGEDSDGEFDRTVDTLDPEDGGGVVEMVFEVVVGEGIADVGSGEFVGGGVSPPYVQTPSVPNGIYDHCQ